MPQMTPSQARVIDPVLTEVARGYRNADFSGMSLFPRVPVTRRGGKVLQFGKEAFQTYNTLRAPGGQVPRVSFGYFGVPFALEQHALEAQVPNELRDEAATVPGIDLARIHINNVQDIIALRADVAQAELALNPLNYPVGHSIALAGANRFSSATANPSTAIEVGKEAIRSKIGRYPNVALIGAPVMAALRHQPLILDRTKYTSRDSATPELLAALWGIPNVLVGGSIRADDSGVFADVWGKNVVLAYVETGSLASMGTPSYGYTYQLSGYPVVEVPYEDRSVKSWIYPVTDEMAPVLAGPDAGYLIRTAVD